MSIDKIQVSAKRDEIINALLQLGVDPTNYEVAIKLNEFFDIKTPGLPYFVPLKQEAHETSDPITYNQMFKDLGVDLDMLYKTNIIINNKVLSVEEYSMIENNKLASEIEKMQLRLNNIEDSANLGQLTKSCTQVFNNFYDIELDGEDNRNIPYTTAFVDLLQKKVYSDKYSYARDKVDLTEAKITLLPLSSPSSFEVYGNLQYVLKDTLNESYTYIAYLREQEAFGVNATVVMKEPREINNLSVSFSSSKPVRAILSISEDGTNFTDLYEISSTSVLEWSFDTSVVSTFKIKMIKDEPDGYGDQSKYEYYFIMKNISASKESYRSKSVYVSKPIDFDEIIGTLTVKAEDIVFPGTQINYYVGLDNGVDKVNWEQIETNEPFDLGILKKKNKIINKANEGYDTVVDATRGVYRVCKVPDNVNINSIKLTPGYQMWCVDKFNLTGTPYADNFNISSFVLDDIVSNVPDTQKSKIFMDCEQYVFNVPGKTFQMMTQFISSKEETVVSDKFVKAVSAASADNLQIRVFVNGYDMPLVNKKYNIRLKKGINKVQILMYNTTTAVISATFNFNFKETSLDTFALTPMKQVDYYNLQNKTAKNTYRSYAIKDGYLVVKHDPRIPGSEITYYLSYKILNKDTSSLIVTKDNIKTVRFRLMAVLLSTNNAMSPQILNYRIIGQ